MNALPHRSGRDRHWPMGVLGALGIGTVELGVLDDPSGSLAVTTLVLLAVVGLVVGLLIEAAEWLGARFQRHGWSLAFARALVVIPLSLPMALTVFEGARAATLPGARWGWAWVPLLLFVLTAIVLRQGARGAQHPILRLVVGGGLLLMVSVLEWINRTVQRAEYPDLHTFLMVVAVAGTGLALRLLVGGPGWRKVSGLLRPSWVLPLLGLALVWTLAFGLTAPSDRWTVARSGMHTRLCVRAFRAALDLDGDGFARVLGRSDCDEFDPDIHPRAIDIPNNGVDENCDGQDAKPLVALPDQTQQMREWREDPKVHATLARWSDMNVLLVVVDALRADALDSAVDHPNLTALLAESRRFTYAFAPSAGTDLSLSGLLTGRIDPFRDIQITLAEGLSDQGKSTYAVIPREVLRYVGSTLMRRGFDRVHQVVNDREQRDIGRETTSIRTTQAGIKLLQRPRKTGSEPFFLWIHYFDVHEHHEIDKDDPLLGSRAERFELSDRRGKYRALFSVIDEQFGALRNHLETQGWWDDTIVVFASDHGESLGEDARLPDNHGRVLYNPLVHIPLAIRIPGVSPAQIATPVSLLDVTPTLFRIHGVSPPATLDGHSLVPLLVDDPPAPRLERGPIPLHESDQVGVIDWPHKLLMRPADNLIEVYDLARDFEERDNLLEREPQVVDHLRRVLQRIPRVELDRTRRGRWLRERAAKAAEVQYRHSARDG